MKKSFLFASLGVFCFLLSSVTLWAASPYFTTTPVSDTVCYAAASASFTAVATDTTAGTFTVSYAWQVSSDGGVTWATASGPDYTGDSSASLTVVVDSSTVLNGYMFRCIAYDVNGSDTSGASDLDIEIMPIAGIIAGYSALCTGLTISLSDASAGGVWSSSNTAIDSVGPTGIVTGVSGGMDTIMYTVTNMCGAASAMKSIQVGNTPEIGVIMGNDSICSGASSTLTDVVPGGVWSTSNNTVATIGSTGTVTSIAQGFDTVSYTISLDTACMGSVSKVIRVDTSAVPMPISGPTATCVGNTITLTDPNVLGTGTWTASNSDANVSSSGDVTGVSSGADVISYSFSNACNSVISSISVTIDTPLAHGSLSGLSSVCAGSWITLTPSLGGGFWLSDSSGIANVDGSGNVTGIAQGTTTISYLFENGCGVTAATMDITVNAPASPIGGIDSVGVGNTTTLTDGTPGGIWSTADTTATVNGTTGVATGVSTGTATITYTVTNLCGTTYATITLNIGVAPSAGSISAGNDSVCIGRTLALTETVTGGVWSSSDNTIATISDGGLVTGISQGYVTITYAYTNAFGTSYATQSIYVNHIPVITMTVPNVFATGSNYFPIAGPRGGRWSSSNTRLGEFVGQYNITFDTLLGPKDTVLDGRDTMIGGRDTLVGGRDTVIDTVDYPNGATFGSFVIVAGGIDTLYYTISNACGTSVAYFVINIPVASAVNTITGAVMSLYPNPNDGTFTVNIPSGAAEDASVIITNIVGQKVKEMTIATNTASEIDLDQPAGIYFLTASTSNGKYTMKITVAK